MADGSTKPIGKVELGDKVLATDPTTGKSAAKPVSVLHHNRDNDLADVTVKDTKTGKKTVLHTTWHHPFWNAGNGQWTDAAKLKTGDKLRSPDGETTQTVAAVKIWTGLKWMQDLTVNDTHTYYVIAGDTPVLVHNCGGEVYGNGGSTRYGALDDLGRPTGVSSSIDASMIKTGTPANPSIRPPGFTGGMPIGNQARGHLLGNQLGGSGDLPQNLVTLTHNPTNSPVMRGFENQIRSAVEGGQVVQLTSTPIYNGNGLVPRGIQMEANGNGGFCLEVCIINPAGR
jgi:hypothetical protein